MQISDILSPQAVKTLVGCSSKKRLFQDIGDLTEAALGIPSARAVEALVERESLGPTGVGHGVALPHARLAEIDRVQGVFLRLEKPVEFGSVDRKPVDLVFALVRPRRCRGRTPQGSGCSLAHAQRSGDAHQATREQRSGHIARSADRRSGQSSSLTSFIPRAIAQHHVIARVSILARAFYFSVIDFRQRDRALRFGDPAKGGRIATDLLAHLR